jgi:hypothetical protein
MLRAPTSFARRLAAAGIAACVTQTSLAASPVATGAPGPPASGSDAPVPASPDVAPVPVPPGSVPEAAPAADGAAVAPHVPPPYVPPARPAAPVDVKLPPTPPPTGIGLLVTGATMIGGIGAPLLVTGAVYGAMLDRATDSDAGQIVAAPLLVSGAVMAGIGAPLLALGLRRVVRHRRWQRAHAWRPGLGRSAHGGWTAGFALRF